MGKKSILADLSGSKRKAPLASPGYQEQELSYYDGILEYLPNAVIITDQEGKPVSYNKTAVAILGEIPSEIHPSDWPRKYGFYLPDGKTLYPETSFPLLKALRGENVEQEEIFYNNDPTGSGKWISLSARRFSGLKEQVDGVLVTFDDITARKEAEKSRLEKEKRIEASYALSRQIAMIGNNPLQIINTVVEFAARMVGDGCVAALLNRSGDRLKIVAYNHHDSVAYELLQKSAVSQEYGLEGVIESVIRSGEPSLIPVVDPASFSRITQTDQKSYLDAIGIHSLLVVPIKGRRGVLGTLSLFKDRGGTPFTSGDQAYIMDIAYRTGLAIDNSSLVRSLRVESSVRRIAQEALELSEVRFRSIFTSTALGIKVLDLNGNIVETNPALQSILGYTEEELKGKPVSSLWHPADAQLSNQLLEKLKTDRVQSFQLEHRLLSKDGSTVWFNVTFTGIKKNEREGGVAFIVAIAENITKRKKIEAEMTEMKSRLHSHVEMERLELAQELHDGPLQDLYSAIYKIEKWDSSFNADMQAKVELLKQDLLKVVQGLRNTAKDLRPPALTNFGLEKAIRSHADEFRKNHPELNIELNLAQDRQTLPEDIRLILFRIYQNSLSNILRHAQANNVNVRFAFDAEEAQLEVRDNGIGFEVPSSWIELVRQGHYGLAGAVERVSLLEGTFTVDSAPGKGTTVRVAIPIRENIDSMEKVGERVKL